MSDPQLTLTTSSPWTITCSDYGAFLQSLPAGSVDLVLTDPPYTIIKETGFANVKTA